MKSARARILTVRARTPVLQQGAVVKRCCCCNRTGRRTRDRNAGGRIVASITAPPRCRPHRCRPSTTRWRLDFSWTRPAPVRGSRFAWSLSSDRLRHYIIELRDGFRFSDGAAVRADACARAQSIEQSGAWHEVPLGSVLCDARLEARGDALVGRLARPYADFAARADIALAIPAALPVDAEGIGAYPAAGPYYVAEYPTPGERIVIQRNRSYGGNSRATSTAATSTSGRAP